ncbi:hypothetical protein, partial [Mycobacteroides abscessus]|uniref:hypothetical protein n=1 Tax=Mycobacteroides abscessus TaxID=36809 RepID=UPI001A991951
ATYSGLDWPYTPHPQRKRSRSLPAAGEVTTLHMRTLGRSGYSKYGVDELRSQLVKIHTPGRDSGVGPLGDAGRRRLALPRRRHHASA